MIARRKSLSSLYIYIIYVNVKISKVMSISLMKSNHDWKSAVKKKHKCINIQLVIISTADLNYARSSKF